jgi:hypothetical protein
VISSLKTIPLPLNDLVKNSSSKQKSWGFSHTGCVATKCVIVHAFQGLQIEAARGIKAMLLAAPA